MHAVGRVIPQVYAPKEPRGVLSGSAPEGQSVNSMHATFNSARASARVGSSLGLRLPQSGERKSSLSVSCTDAMKGEERLGLGNHAPWGFEEDRTCDA